MYLFELLSLLENKLNWLKKNFLTQAEKIAASDPDLSGMPPEEVIDAVAAYDPEPKNSFTQQLLTWMMSGSLKFKDLSGYQQELKTFANPNIRKSLKRQNINQYNSIEDLHDAVKYHSSYDLLSGKQKKKATSAKAQEGIRVLHDRPELRVIQVLNREAAIIHGKGTKWCTSSKATDHFSSYNNQGPIYIIFDNDAKRKWQWHFPSDQFKNEDQSINDPTELLLKFPELRNIFKSEIEKYHGPLKDKFKERALQQRIKDNPYLITELDKGLQTEELWDIATDMNPGIIPDAPEWYQLKNPDKVANYLFYSPFMITNFPRELQTDETWAEVLKSDPFLVRSAPEKFQTHENWKQGMKKMPEIVQFAPEEYQTVEIWEKALDKRMELIPKAPRELQTYDRWRLAIANKKADITDLEEGILSTEETKYLWEDSLDTMDQEKLVRLIPRAPSFVDIDKSLISGAIRKDPNVIFRIPDYRVTDDLRIRAVLEEPELIHKIKPEDRSLLLWKVAKETKENTGNSIGYDLPPVIVRYENYLNDIHFGNKRIQEIPEEYYTEEMWYLACTKRNVEPKEVPVDKRNEHTWKLVLRDDPFEVFNAKSPSGNLYRLAHQGAIWLEDADFLTFYKRLPDEHKLDTTSVARVIELVRDPESIVPQSDIEYFEFPLDLADYYAQEEYVPTVKIEILLGEENYGTFWAHLLGSKHTEKLMQADEIPDLSIYGNRVPEEIIDSVAKNIIKNERYQHLIPNIPDQYFKEMSQYERYYTDGDLLAPLQSEQKRILWDAMD